MPCVHCTGQNNRQVLRSQGASETVAMRSKCAFKLQDAALYEVFAGVLFRARRRRLVRRQAVLQDHRSGEVLGEAR